MEHRVVNKTKVPAVLELTCLYEQHMSELHGSTYTQIFFSSEHGSATPHAVGWICGCGGTVDMRGTADMEG